MVMLITGASHTGKTMLAQRLLEKYHYPYLSVDHLKMGLIRSGNTDLSVEDDEGLTAYLWPIVREMMKTVIENGQDLIVEGCYVPFGWREDIGEEYAGSVRSVCLVMSDSYIDRNIGLINEKESVIEHRLESWGCDAAYLKEENRKYLEGFSAAGERIVMIDLDHVSGIEKAVEMLKQM